FSISKILKQTEAASPSSEKRTVIVIADYVYAPIGSRPPAPGDRQRLAVELSQARRRPNQLIRFFPQPRAYCKVLPLIPSTGHCHETGRRKDRARIAEVEIDPFFDDPRFLKVVRAAEIEAVVTMHIFGRVVTKARSRDPLFPSQPFFVQESIGTISRPEESADACSQGQRTVPIPVEVVGVASRHIDASVAELVLAIHLGIPDVFSLLINAACVAASPVAVAVAQRQIVASAFHVICQRFRLDLALSLGDQRFNGRGSGVRRCCNNLRPHLAGHRQTPPQNHHGKAAKLFCSCHHHGPLTLLSNCSSVPGPAITIQESLSRTTLALPRSTTGSEYFPAGSRQVSCSRVCG